jgi:adenylate cyclase
MTWRSRRRGIFEGLPRALYRTAGAGYFDACAAGIVINGVVVAGFGVVALVLYVDLSAGELALFAACSAVGFAVEGLLAAVYSLRAAGPARAWLAGGRSEEAAPQAWSAAASLPLVLVRRPTLYATGAVGAGAADVVLAALLDLPVYQAALLFPTSYLLYVSSTVLRYVALELAMRPVLEDIGESASGESPPDFARVSLHRRLLATVPMVTWGTALIVAGLLTHNARDLDTIGRASVVAVLVTAAVSLWLSLVLADAVSGPIIDLRDATRQLSGGDLAVRVPVVSTDETGELAAAFNAMVAGLGEREQLREAFGTFVDPALTERVLAEGTDLRGEEIEASVLFLDVRGFTAFAERAAAQEVVAALNELYDAVVPVIERHGGHANKFIGDGLLAVFGAPERHADHAARAVAAACEIVQRMSQGDAGELRVGIGVNSGRVVAGTIGGGSRRDFTVIGDTVNTAAGVEAATRLTGDAILITETTLSALGAAGDDFEERPSVPLKGKAATVRLYAPRPEAAPPLSEPFRDYGVGWPVCGSRNSGGAAVLRAK